MIPGSGTYFCLRCGAQLSLGETDELPGCANCGASNYRRDSIFESMQDHGLTSEFALPSDAGVPDWLDDARDEIPAPGHYLARRSDGGEITTFEVEEGWTRIGRSPKADLRLDHPSVSRRHALIVCEPGRDLRVLDDRSLNGVFVNGEPVEWATLRDSDELTIGRFDLYALRA